MNNKFSWEKFKSSKTYIILIGLLATIWFLIRVIPKPSRARYPCMQAAAPLMSSFVIYLLGLSASLISFKKFKQSIQASRYWIGAGFLFLAIISFGVILVNDNKTAVAEIISPLDETFPIPSNEPIGTAIGLFPGRVVWVQDVRATNENYVPLRNSNDFWYLDNNVDEEIVKEMLSNALMKYADKDNPVDAWDAIFRAFNNSHGRGDVGYKPGEKIAFKINLTNQGSSNAERPMRMDVAPQLLNAILHELVNNVGVAQSDITLGDPYREFRSEYRNLVQAKYPDVYYVDGNGGNGIHQTIPTQEAVLKFSDKNIESTLPQQYVDATYVINIPALKTHNEGGITLIAKNHQGSFLEVKDREKTASQYAIAMHYSLPANNRGTRKYRHTVDYMGHEQTGGKGLIYIIDGLWAGESWEGWISKFKSAPFDNDYPNSILVGQDPVALESVCYDILFNEYVTDDSKQPYPIRFKAEIADYLSQCANSNYWPEGIVYDPEGDGSPMGSLGVFEHWNNPEDRQYSRNLGTGDGIELVYLKSDETAINSNQLSTIGIASPNPFSEVTRFRKPAQISGKANLEIFNLNGQLVKTFNFSGTEIIAWDGTDSRNQVLSDGVYVYNIRDLSDNSVFTGKVMLKKAN